MSANIFGERVKIITFGESHGVALGVVIDGVPAGVLFDPQIIQNNLRRRKPGISPNSINIVSPRNEDDQFEVLSGLFEGKTLGTPIALIVKNKDQRSSEYDKIKESPRLGHADDVWKSKFEHVDYRGGGRSSGRETVSRVLAGSIAEMYFQQLFPQTIIKAFALQIGPHRLSLEEQVLAVNEDVDSFHCRFPSRNSMSVYEDLLKIQKEGDSYGGLVEVVIKNAPQGLGQPVFHKLKNDLASAMLSIGAVNGFDLGSGFSDVELKGTEYHTQKNNEKYGGLRGGISTGDEIRFRLSFKPTSSIGDVAKKGRHDPCILIRAIPVIESMAWLTLLDHALWIKTDRI